MAPRTIGVGAITAQEAIDYGCTGPVLRACGVNEDVRRSDEMVDQVPDPSPDRDPGHHGPGDGPPRPHPGPRVALVGLWGHGRPSIATPLRSRQSGRSPFPQVDGSFRLRL